MTHDRESDLISDHVPPRTAINRLLELARFLREEVPRERFDMEFFGYTLEEDVIRGGKVKPRAV